MFEEIGEKGILNVEISGEPTERDLLITTAVLMSGLGSSDEQFALIEQETVARLLGSCFGLDKAQAGDVFSVAQHLVEDRECYEKFIGIVSERFSIEQREKVVAMLWKVAVADSVVEENETRFFAEVAVKLGLSEDCIMKAKELAESA